MLAKLTFKNQITIPKTVLEAFPHTEYFDVTRRNNAILLRPVAIKPAGEHLAAIRAKVKALGLTVDDLDSAIQWARRGSP